VTRLGNKPLVHLLTVRAADNSIRRESRVARKAVAAFAEIDSKPRSALSHIETQIDGLSRV